MATREAASDAGTGRYRLRPAPQTPRDATRPSIRRTGPRSGRPGRASVRGAACSTKRGRRRGGANSSARASAKRVLSAPLTPSSPRTTVSAMCAPPMPARSLSVRTSRLLRPLASDPTASSCSPMAARTARAAPVQKAVGVPWRSRPPCARIRTTSRARPAPCSALDAPDALDALDALAVIGEAPPEAPTDQRLPSACRSPSVVRVAALRAAMSSRVAPASTRSRARRWAGSRTPVNPVSMTGTIGPGSESPLVSGSGRATAHRRSALRRRRSRSVVDRSPEPAGTRQATDQLWATLPGQAGSRRSVRPRSC